MKEKLASTVAVEKDKFFNMTLEQWVLTGTAITVVVTIIWFRKLILKLIEKQAVHNQGTLYALNKNSEDVLSLRIETEVIKRKITKETLLEIQLEGLLSYAEKGLYIRVEHFPNKDMKGLHLSIPLDIQGRLRMVYPVYNKDEHDVHTVPQDVQNWCKSLFATKMVEEVSLKPFTITVTKPQAIQWNHVLETILPIIASWYPEMKTEE